MKVLMKLYDWEVSPESSVLRKCLADTSYGKDA